MPQVNGKPIESLDEYVAWERRAWHSAWADRGLKLTSMSKDEAEMVRELDEERAKKMRRSEADLEC